MSTASMSAASLRVRDTLEAGAVRGREQSRGRWGMALFIATEAMLFALLFFAYFYLAASRARWPFDRDPSYFYALFLLGILLTSSLTLHWGQRGLERGALTRFKVGLGITLGLGGLFLGVQYVEYAHHLRDLTPLDNAYGSIFYTITTFHLAHVVVGVLMLAFTFALALKGHFSRSRTETVKNVSYYWHFVDAVWLFVVATLYIAPHFYGPP